MPRSQSKAFTCKTRSPRSLWQTLELRKGFFSSSSTSGWHFDGFSLIFFTFSFTKWGSITMAWQFPHFWEEGEDGNYGKRERWAWGLGSCLHIFKSWKNLQRAPWLPVYFFMCSMSDTCFQLRRQIRRSSSSESASLAAAYKTFHAYGCHFSFLCKWFLFCV